MFFRTLPDWKNAVSYTYSGARHFILIMEKFMRGEMFMYEKKKKI